MSSIESLKLKLGESINYISKTVRGLIRVVGNIIGIRKRDGRYGCHRIVSTGWVFLVGIPVGFILLGPYFSISIWALTVIVLTIFCNLDYIYETYVIKDCKNGSYSWT